MADQSALRQQVQSQRQQIQTARAQVQQVQARVIRPQAELRKAARGPGQLQARAMARAEEQRKTKAKAGALKSIETQSREFEQQVARQAPSQAKAEYLEPVFLEAQAKAEQNITRIEKSIEQAKIQKGKATRGYDRDKYTDRIEILEQRLRGWREGASGDKVAVIKKVLSGQAQRLADFYGDRKESKQNRREQLNTKFKEFVDKDPFAKKFIEQSGGLQKARAEFKRTAGKAADIHKVQEFSREFSQPIAREIATGKNGTFVKSLRKGLKGVLGAKAGEAELKRIRADVNKQLEVKQVMTMASPSDLGQPTMTPLPTAMLPTFDERAAARGTKIQTAFREEGVVPGVLESFRTGFRSIPEEFGIAAGKGVRAVGLPEAGIRTLPESKAIVPVGRGTIQVDPMTGKEILTKEIIIPESRLTPTSVEKGVKFGTELGLLATGPGLVLGAGAAVAEARDVLITKPLQKTTKADLMGEIPEGIDKTSQEFKEYEKSVQAEVEAYNKSVETYNKQLKTQKILAPVMATALVVPAARPFKNLKRLARLETKAGISGGIGQRYVKFVNKKPLKQIGLTKDEFAQLIVSEPGSQTRRALRQKSFGFLEKKRDFQGMKALEEVLTPKATTTKALKLDKLAQEDIVFARQVLRDSGLTAFKTEKQFLNYMQQAEIKQGTKVLTSVEKDAMKRLGMKVSDTQEFVSIGFGGGTAKGGVRQYSLVAEKTAKGFKNPILQLVKIPSKGKKLSSLAEVTTVVPTDGQAQITKTIGVVKNIGSGAAPKYRVTGFTAPTAGRTGPSSGATDDFLSASFPTEQALKEKFMALPKREVQLVGNVPTVGTLDTELVSVALKKNDEFLYKAAGKIKTARVKSIEIGQAFKVDFPASVERKVSLVPGVSKSPLMKETLGVLGESQFAKQVAKKEAKRLSRIKLSKKQRETLSVLGEKPSETKATIPSTEIPAPKPLPAMVGGEGGAAAESIFAGQGLRLDDITEAAFITPSPGLVKTPSVIPRIDVAKGVRGAPLFAETGIVIKPADIQIDKFVSKVKADEFVSIQPRISSGVRPKVEITPAIRPSEIITPAIRPAQVIVPAVRPAVRVTPRVAITPVIRPAIRPQTIITPTPIPPQPKPRIEPPRPIIQIPGGTQPRRRIQPAPKPLPPKSVFAPQIRVRGKFVQVAPVVATRRAAEIIAARKVLGKAAATARAVKISVAPGTRIKRRKVKPLTLREQVLFRRGKKGELIQKKRLRILSPGEVKEISLKGAAAVRKKSGLGSPALLLPKKKKSVSKKKKRGSKKKR